MTRTTPESQIKRAITDYKFCELCEAKSERRDALQMEQHYKQRAEKAEAELATAREGKKP